MDECGSKTVSLSNLLSFSFLFVHQHLRITCGVLVYENLLLPVIQRILTLSWNQVAQSTLGDEKFVISITI